VPVAQAPTMHMPNKKEITLDNKARDFMAG
jgi:hypothetical protein